MSVCARAHELLSCFVCCVIFPEFGEVNGHICVSQSLCGACMVVLITFA